MSVHPIYWRMNTKTSRQTPKEPRTIPISAEGSRCIAVRTLDFRLTRSNSLHRLKLGNPKGLRKPVFAKRSSLEKWRPNDWKEATGSTAFDFVIFSQVFQCGFRSSRLFRNNFFIWDILGELVSYRSLVKRDPVYVGNNLEFLRVCRRDKPTRDDQENTRKSFYCINWSALKGFPSKRKAVSLHMKHYDNFLRVWDR